MQRQRGRAQHQSRWWPAGMPQSPQKPPAAGGEGGGEAVASQSCRRGVAAGGKGFVVREKAHLCGPKRRCSRPEAGGPGPESRGRRSRSKNASGRSEASRGRSRRGTERRRICCRGSESSTAHKERHGRFCDAQQTIRIGTTGTGAPDYLTRGRAPSKPWSSSECRCRRGPEARLRKTAKQLECCRLVVACLPARERLREGGPSHTAGAAPNAEAPPPNAGVAVLPNADGVAAPNALLCCAPNGEACAG